MRADDPLGVHKFSNMYKDGVALIVLGGLSAQNWEQVRDEVKPDVILGANGTCMVIDDLDFWMLAENMHLSAGRAAKGQKRYQEFMRIITTKHNARHRLISCLSWDLIHDKTDCVSIRRMGEAQPDGYERQIDRFDFRRYGEGYLHGPMFDNSNGALNPKVRFRLGTVAVHLLHHAGILGVREVHTVGMDFCFKNIARHHFYEYPTYTPDKFRTEKMFVEYMGLPTQWDWVQAALWLESIENIFERDGLEWHDHSDGLLQMMGLWCADE